MQPRTRRRARTAIGAAAALVVLGLAWPAGAAVVDGIQPEARPAEAGHARQAAPDGFYVDPTSNPKTWVNDNQGDPRAQRIDEAIASKPMAKWFGNWNADIKGDVEKYVGDAAAANKMPVLVAYNIPGRDCGGHSGGGAGSPEAYRAWIDGFANGLADKPAIVVIEPDALPQLDCLPNDDERRIRTEMIKYAVDKLTAQNPNTLTYLDAGTSNWIPADEMGRRMKAAGLDTAHGFAINVSNYYPTEDSIAYSKNVNASLGTNKPFVVDTSRNGNGSNGEWCNPSGRKLGATATNDAGEAEMLLWIKVPGDSDGECGSAPGVPAGTFSPDLAMALIEGTS